MNEWRWCFVVILGCFLLVLSSFLDGTSAEAVDLRCSTVCGSDAPCDDECTDGGGWTSCAEWGDCAWCGPVQSTGQRLYVGVGATSCEQVRESCQQDQHDNISCPGGHPTCGEGFQSSPCSEVTCGGQVCGYQLYCITTWTCRN